MDGKYFQRRGSRRQPMGLQARQYARARAGAAFSLKDFHAKALSLGAMGLDPLREALARI